MERTTRGTYVKDRFHGLAKQLTLWALSDEGDERVRKLVREFLSTSDEALRALRRNEEELARLHEQRRKLANDLVASFYLSAETADELLREQHKVNDPAYRLADLVFWGCLKQLNEDVYSFLQPRWEELERLVLERKINRTQRAQWCCEELVKKEDLENRRPNDGEENEEKED